MIIILHLPDISVPLIFFSPHLVPFTFIPPLLLIKMKFFFMKMTFNHKRFLVIIWFKFKLKVMFAKPYIQSVGLFC